MKYLYTDGGVILKNPSIYGGTWAWCLVENDKILQSDSGYVIPSEVANAPVTNNQTELLAVIKGLKSLYSGDVVEVRSDSEITLGRIFKGYAFNNIPMWMLEELSDAKRRLASFNQFRYLLMDGHPTQAQIDRGFGKRGHITSKWNVWCDKECNRQANLFLKFDVLKTVYIQDS